MAKLTKRQKAIAAAVEANKVYTLEEAVQVLNSLPAAKFKESLDIAVNLGVDPRKSDQVGQWNMITSSPSSTWAVFSLF